MHTLATNLASLRLWVRLWGAATFFVVATFVASDMFFAQHARIRWYFGMFLVTSVLVLLAISLAPRKATGAWHWIWSKAIPLVFSPATVAAASAFFTLYRVSYERYGKVWSAFSDHPGLHNAFSVWGYAVLAGAAAITWLQDRVTTKSLATTETLFLSFVGMAGRIVEAKKVRLAERAPTMPSSKKFEYVTHPKEHIQVIASEAARFLEASFGLQESQVDITVLEKRGSDKWGYFFQHQSNWKHAAEDPVSPGTCAFVVFSHGHRIFHASKEVAARDGVYALSERDKEKGDGSIYCAPVEVQCPDLKWNFIVSIVTYGSRLCDPGDHDNEIKTEVLLREIVRRIELELHLRAMKSK